MAGGGAPTRGPAGPGRIPGGGEDAAGVLREEVLEAPPYCLGGLEATYFYIINGIRGPRMPRRRGSWLSTVPWVGGVERRPPGGFGEWPFRVVPLRLGIFRHVYHLVLES